MTVLRKAFAVFFGVLSIIVAFRIGGILIYDFHRLTEYGLGYLAGLAILFVISLVSAIILGTRGARRDEI